MLIFFLTTAGTDPALQRRTAEEYESLLMDLANGHMQALELLYAETSVMVYGFALSIMKDRHHAEEVMQDTYVRLFHAAKSYRPQGKPMAWILTIVRNLSLMKLRNRREMPVEDDPNRSIQGDFSENSIDRIVLHAALEGLTDEERQIVILHSVSGLKHREIAEILTIPLSTVLSKYRRALSKLRVRLEGEEK